MDAGISVFDKDVRIPGVCNDFSVIPKAHLDWFKALFVNNDRTLPPTVQEVAIVQIPHTFTLVDSSENFKTKIAKRYKDTILLVRNFMGVNYIVGAKGIYKEDDKLPIHANAHTIELCESSDMSPVVCKFKDELVEFEDAKCDSLGQINSVGMMYRNGAIYTAYDGKLIENTFMKVGNKTVYQTRMTCNVLDNATKFFDGVIFQDLLGKWFVTLPYEKGRCALLQIKELERYRILEAKAEGNICVVVGEKRGKYNRFVIAFSDNFTQYSIRKAGDIPYSSVNFTVLPNGVCILNTEMGVEVFKDDKVKVIADPPFDSSMRLFNYSGGVYYVDDKKIVSVHMK